MGDEKVLDQEQWRVEVTAVISDIKCHLQKADVSSLEGTNEHIYFNITTLEGKDFCIQMSKNGFSVADTCHDSARSECNLHFETPYSLLDKISPKYRESFAKKLIDSLNAVAGV